MNAPKMDNWPGLVLVGAMALAGGSGGTVATLSAIPERPDPFTGTEGRVLERRIEALEEQNRSIHQLLTDIHIKTEILIRSRNVEELKKTDATPDAFDRF